MNVLAGATVYSEAGRERFGLITRGLLRVYMHTSDGRQVTVRYVRRGGLLGAPALVAGPAPVYVQALMDSTLCVVLGQIVTMLVLVGLFSLPSRRVRSVPPRAAPGRIESRSSPATAPGFRRQVTAFRRSGR